jgi:hypothetical protein
MGQRILLWVGSNDLAGPVTPTNRMTVRIRGIWRTGSATYYGLKTTGIGGQWGFSRFLPLVEMNISKCRHKNPTKIRIRAQGPTVR